MPAKNRAEYERRRNGISCSAAIAGGIFAWIIAITLWQMHWQSVVDSDAKFMLRAYEASSKGADLRAYLSDEAIVQLRDIEKKFGKVEGYRVKMSYADGAASLRFVELYVRRKKVEELEEAELYGPYCTAIRVIPDPLVHAKQ